MRQKRLPTARQTEPAAHCPMSETPCGYRVRGHAARCSRKAAPRAPIPAMQSTRKRGAGRRCASESQALAGNRLKRYDERIGAPLECASPFTLCAVKHLRAPARRARALAPTAATIPGTAGPPHQPVCWLSARTFRRRQSQPPTCRATHSSQ